MSKRFTQEELDALDGDKFPEALLKVYREDYLLRVEREVDVVMSSRKETYAILEGKDLPLSQSDAAKLEYQVRLVLLAENHPWAVSADVVQVLADRYARMFKANY